MIYKFYNKPRLVINILSIFLKLINLYFNIVIKYCMDSNLIVCKQCGDADSVAYYCCSQEELVCFRCSKQLCPNCKKKKNNPYKIVNQNGKGKKSEEFITCVFCTKICLKDSIEFSCKHYSCMKCLFKKIQQKIKYGIWEQSFKTDKIKRLTYCSCTSKKQYDVSELIKTHCICCGEKLLQDKSILLKYGLNIKESCRYKIVFEIEHHQKFDKEDLMKLTKSCRSCSKIIDGYNIKIGLQNNFSCQCQKCFQIFQGQNEELFESQCNLIMNYCTACSRQFMQNDMIFQENQFYLCKKCLKQSKKASNQRNIKEKQQMNKQQQDSSNKLKYSESMNNFKSLKEKEFEKLNELKLEQQAKQAKQAKQRQKQKKETPLLKRPSVNQKKQIKCIVCYRNFSQQQKEIQSEVQICQECYDQNIKNLTLKNAKTQPNRKKQDIKSKQHFRSSRQRNEWRKNVDFKEFLKNTQQLNFSQQIKKQTNSQQQKMRKKIIRQNVKPKNIKYALYSVIQQIPDADILQIPLPQQITADCYFCGYTLNKDCILQYKYKESCLGCFMAAQAKQC